MFVKLQRVRAAEKSTKQRQLTPDAVIQWSSYDFVTDEITRQFLGCRELIQAYCIIHNVTGDVGLKITSEKKKQKKTKFDIVDNS